MSQTEVTIWQEIAEVKDAVSQVLEHAKQLGASSAEASMNRTRGLSVETRHGEVETVEFNQDGGLGISIYVGQRKGSASTADLSPAALKRTVEAAIDIARYTNSEGASFSSHQGLKVYGNSHGQLVGYPSSRHSLSCVVIGEDGDDMQRDYSYTVAR